MQRLVALALAICNSLYVAVTVCSGLVFGPALQPDVLSNVTAAAMGPLIGPAAAGIMAASVRLGYLLSIIGSYVLLCYPLRQVCGWVWVCGCGQGLSRCVPAPCWRATSAHRVMCIAAACPAH
jgi:hypothetical protein